jgi:EAL domain-containing protein (putative c-di-GMP-specific phosphodiesterase class I)
MSMSTERGEIDHAPDAPAWRPEELASASANGEFFLLYQPTIDLQTNAFVGVEALLRWRHPRLGVLGPDKFLPALESGGAIVEVGAWVIATACQQGVSWHSRGHRFSVSVNVSARQLEAASFVSDVDRSLEMSRFDAGHLVLEFSERALSTHDEAAAVLEDLKRLGVQLAVDDFGAEPTSEALVSTLPIDVVKIDRAYITELSTSEGGAARVHQLVQLGKALHVRTVAQGVEDDDQRLALQDEHVDLGQGFLFSVPHEVEAIDRFLEDYAIFSGKPL